MITIKLSKRAADVLFTICGRITGPENGPRGITNEIYEKLSTAGMSDVSTGNRNTINFEGWPENQCKDVEVVCSP